MNYVRNTTVAVNRARDETDETVNRYGADGCAYATQGSLGCVYIQTQHRHNTVRPDPTHVKYPHRKRTTQVMTMDDWSACTAIEGNPAKVSGAWVFRGTRVPVTALFNNLRDGATIDEFMEWFPGVTRHQVEAVLTHQAQSLDNQPQHENTAGP